MISTDRAWCPAVVVDDGGDRGEAAATTEGALASSTRRYGGVSSVWPMSACWGREGGTEEGKGQGKGVAE